MAPPGLPEPDICPYFGACGGCSSQDVPYEAQLASKSEALGTLLARWWRAPIPVVASPRIWHYRNKVELNFGRKHYPEPPPKDFEKETVLGFKRRGKWYWTLDLDECRIGPEGLDELLPSVRHWYRQAGLRAHDSRRRDGLLRHLLVRVGQRTGERLVMAITAPGELDGAGLVAAVHAVWPGANVLHGVNPGRGDQATAETIEVLSGSETFEEALEIDLGSCSTPARFRFRISPLSFFQTNTEATEVLYGLVRRWVAELSPRVLFDFYGGSGGIAFACADRVERVESVESWAPASADGVHNAAANGIENVSFTADSVERYLGRLKVSKEGFPDDAAVVLDPPRAGLHPKALRRLGEIGPRYMLYVSCKPTTLARELESLGEAYEVVDATAVDLFPHTPHTELVVALERRAPART